MLTLSSDLRKPLNSENKPRGLYFSKALFEGLIFGGAYAPINVNPVGGGGVRARGGDLTNFKIFGSNSPAWETKGQSKVSKKPPPQEKKSKQTIL